MPSAKRDSPAAAPVDIRIGLPACNRSLRTRLRELGCLENEVVDRLLDGKEILGGRQVGAARRKTSPISLSPTLRNGRRSSKRSISSRSNTASGAKNSAGGFSPPAGEYHGKLQIRVCASARPSPAWPLSRRLRAWPTAGAARRACPSTQSALRGPCPSGWGYRAGRRL